MNLHMTRSAVALLAATALAGCASINSTPTTEPGDGLVYYMPKKDIVVTVVREAAKTTATIDTTSAYPDMDQPFVLNFGRNLVGRNELNIGIGSTGLLTSAKSTTTSGIADALKNLATSLGTLHGMAAPPAPAVTCPLGTFTYMYAAADATHNPCGLTVRIQRVAASKPSALESSAVKKAAGSTGVFYRQQEAYRVDVVGTVPAAVNTSSIVLSPSAAPLRFLPIERTLFANNKADFTFVDGVPTKYDQEADGELIGLFKLPADVAGAYFTAVGNIFGTLKTNRGAESEALAADVQLEMAKMKYAECIRALREKNDTLVQQLECGK
ncbi:MAG TPA: hypothetical protein VNB23_04095 [Ramlibacter sp.]|nr:hypothetical protein [Ramlibacter sp.]